MKYQFCASIGFLKAAGLILAASGTLLAANANARVITVVSSAYSVQHNSGFGTPEVADSFGPSPVAGTVGYNQTLFDGSNSSAGMGGMGQSSRPQKLTGFFPVGTGISQDWVDAPSHEAAELIIDFSVTWDMYAGFGPSFTSRFGPLFSGTVSDNGWVSFSYTATFTGYPGGETPGRLTGSYFNDVPGAFTFDGVGQSPLFDSNRVPGLVVPRDSTIELTGQLKFEAYDGSDEESSSIQYDGSTTGGIIATPIPAAFPLLAAAAGALALLGRRTKA